MVLLIARTLEITLIHRKKERIELLLPQDEDAESVLNVFNVQQIG